MGRTARGVRGMRLRADECVIGLVIAEQGFVLTATENGFGKRTPVDDYPAHGRGGQGVISIRTTARNGKVIGAALVHESDEIMLISSRGTLVRLRAAEVSTIGRNTQGVKLVSLEQGERLVGLQRLEELDTE